MRMTLSSKFGRPIAACMMLSATALVAIATSEDLVYASDDESQTSAGVVHCGVGCYGRYKLTGRTCAPGQTCCGVWDCASDTWREFTCCAKIPGCRRFQSPDGTLRAECLSW